MGEIKKLGNIYPSGGQNGCIYDIDGISPTLSSGVTDNPRNGGVGSNNAPKIFVDTDNTKGNDNVEKIYGVFEGKPFNYVSLFSGIGGFEQALNGLGGNCVMASEIDRFANHSYEILYGHPTAGDVTKVAAEDVPDHDMLVGGFPCQAFSVAGKRLGFEDTRGTLFFEIARIAAVKRPRVILLENVKGLISHDKGKTLDTIIQALHEIGYTMDFEVMNSKYFGVPQNRERIFIVAIRNDLVESAEWDVGKRSDVVAKGKRRISELGVRTFNFDWPAQGEVAVRLRDILESDVDEKFYLSEEKTAKLVAQLEGKTNHLIIQRGRGNNPGGIKAIDGIIPTISKSAWEDNNHLGEPQGLPIREATKQGYAIAKEGDAVNFQFPDSKTRRGRVGDQIANTLEASNINQGVVEEIAALTERRTEEAKTLRREFREKYGKDFSARRAKIVVPREDDIANCVTSTQGIEQQLLEKPHYRIRKLTPRECFRLQGFPDVEFDKLTAIGADGKQLVSNSQLYKQAGNAVTVNVIDAIGRRLLAIL